MQVERAKRAERSARAPHEQGNALRDAEADALRAASDQDLRRGRGDGAS